MDVGRPTSGMKYGGGGGGIGTHLHCHPPRMTLDSSLSHSKQYFALPKVVFRMSWNRYLYLSSRRGVLSALGDRTQGDDTAGDRPKLTGESGGGGECDAHFSHVYLSPQPGM